MCEHHEWKKNENSMWFFFFGCVAFALSSRPSHRLMQLFVLFFRSDFSLFVAHFSTFHTRRFATHLFKQFIFTYSIYFYYAVAHNFVQNRQIFFRTFPFFLSLFIIIFFLAALFLCARLVHCWRMWIHFFSVHCHCAPMLFAVRSSTNTLWCGWIFYFCIRNNASFSSSANANEIITEHESKEKSHWPSTENEFFVNHWPAALRSRTN